MRINFLIIVTLIHFSYQNEPVSVEIPNGQLIGEQRNHFYAFEGIPYAQAPIGELRFEPPQPYSSNWSEPREVKQPGASCMQWDHFKFDVEDKLRGSEDCLFINVYTPSLEKGKQMPVFVFIHGGAFIFGNGDFYGPDVITSREGILVNFNYRLGPLGFLTTENEIIPGNMGLKDQVHALKWVQNNIAHFGGDPEKVTIMGWSAGGASVHMHYLSPLSRGLFKTGISHSGCSLNPWVFMEKGKERAEKLSTIVNCPTDSTESMINCLKNQPAENIVRAVEKFQPWLFNPFSPFGATVEFVHTEGAFITQKPIEILRSGNFQKLPWIASACDAEGLYPAAEYVRHENYLPELDSKWNEIIPNIMHYTDTIEIDKQDEVSQKVREFYLKDQKLDRNTFRKLVDAMSDRLYDYGLSQSTRLQGKYSPAYFYHFNFKTVYSYAEFMSNSTENIGVAHSEDVGLLYKLPIRNMDEYPHTDEEKVMIERLLDMYYSFSETGEPKLGTFSLQKIDPNEPKLLKFNHIKGPNEIIPEESDNYGNEEFWTSLAFDEN